MKYLSLIRGRGHPRLRRCLVPEALRRGHVVGVMVATVLAVGSATGAEALRPARMQELKKEMEEDLRFKVSDFLDKVLGVDHRSTISVMVTYTSGGRVVRKTVRKRMKRQEDRPWEPFAPGIRNLRRATIQAPTDEDVTEETTPLKWKKVITIMLNDIFQSRIKDLEARLKRLLQLNEKAGDRLTIEATPFARGTASVIQSATRNPWLLVLLMAGIFLFVFIVFLFGPIRMFMKGMVNAFSESKARQFSIEMGGAAPAVAGGGGVASVLAGGPAGVLAGGAAAAGGGGATTMDTSATAVAEEGGSIMVAGGSAGTKVAMVRPFSFIKKNNIPNLVYLVQEEPPDIIGLIMTYLNPDEAAELMASLPRELQTQVALAMATVKQASYESVVRAEELVKKKLDFLIGGVERFVTILDRVDIETREEIISTLAKENPAVAERIRKEIFAFENLIDLEDQALQLVLREVRTDTLGKALRDAPEELSNKIKANISAGAQTLLAEEMDLQGYVTPAQVGEERRKIMDLVRRFDREGKIALRRGRRRAERIQRLERLGETVGSGEQAVALPQDQRDASPPEEKKVSLTDYERRGGGRALSMAAMFREAGARSDRSGGRAQPEERLVTAGEGGRAPDRSKATEHYNAATATYQQRTYDDALRGFQACMEQDPGFWQAQQGIGNCYTAMGSVAQAISAYEQALSINPNNPGLRQWLEQYKAKQGV